MSIIKQKKQRVAIFIDAQNLYHSAKSLYGANVNFGNILNDTLAERELVRAIAYVIKTESGEEGSFFEALTKSGIETKSKDLQIFYGGAKKGDWDVGMTVDAIRLASKVDSVIIISGDGDFIPLVEYLKFNSGCQVEAATFLASASAGLVEVVDDFFDLSENLDRYLMRSFKYGRYKHFKNRPDRKKSLKENLDNNNNLEQETPEMVAERFFSKRGVLDLKKKEKTLDFKKENSKKIKEATEVEISRVKKEDFIQKENTGKVLKLEIKKEKKIKKKTIVPEKKSFLKRKSTKQIKRKKEKVKEAEKKAVVKKNKIIKSAKK